MAGANFLVPPPPPPPMDPEITAALNVVLGLTGVGTSVVPSPAPRLAAVPGATNGAAGGGQARSATNGAAGGRQGDGDVELEEEDEEWEEEEDEEMEEDDVLWDRRDAAPAAAAAAVEENPISDAWVKLFVAGDKRRAEKRQREREEANRESRKPVERRDAVRLREATELYGLETATECAHLETALTARFERMRGSMRPRPKEWQQLHSDIFDMESS
eukprot:Hpha_TRINITY_DN4797_c0_g1::TRINITY_DN4797_c0_g1_i2::g.130603::m.130603